MTADTITAIKKAFPNMFRPLEWHHFDGKTEHGYGEWWAHGSRGMFHIYDVREKFPNDRPFYAKELSDQLDTLEMAQEAFQKRHEMDIVMCLDPSFLSTLESLQRENEESKERIEKLEQTLKAVTGNKIGFTYEPTGEGVNLYSPNPSAFAIIAQHPEILQAIVGARADIESRAALSSTGDTHGN
ncbi:hypothetical protein RMR10_004400 [Agrobacterium rosae]|uniref:hypothetical protein n=1 Tax=Agrobacterium rosae TaxID=1972867 RepID=UPI002A0EDA1F|nr:hypothetical protein [Agrobacterium rosae]MDX8315638.1 hypothetical protein [Agrobacterium rosae]